MKRALVAAVLLMAGCASPPRLVWVKDGVSPEEAWQDWNAAILKAEEHGVGYGFSSTAAAMDSSRRQRAIVDTFMQSRGYRVEVESHAPGEVPYSLR